ncbi:hypothetical protein PRK78_006673 [Emydomyces testavorans]|uniref:Aminoglycoside phosphotransferase domain-containing protein n=1 Tax=Emydomyces testavorans TaxID=2070801 RepID=A0AAF0IL07_9EURO|nr:hypothetical protein PRK78_006673 [Emydomyces testavorans]
MVDWFPQVGSDAWTGGEEYQEEYALRIKHFQQAFVSSALLAKASSLRHNIRCNLSDKFSVGNFNYVKKVIFEDGVEWIARLRMPPIEGAEANLEKEQIVYEMQSEIATMEFVRRHTNIPVPKVHAYEFRENNNPVGVPYSLMDYVHGSTAEELSNSYPGDHEGIPEKYADKFMRQVAQIMVQLAALRLPKIGSIVPMEKDSTESGPYKTASEFYQDYPIALAKTLYSDNWVNKRQILNAFLDLAATFPQSSSGRDGFGLANYDLGPNNFIVDAEFNVLAVIDWDSVIAVPDAALHRFPFLMGMDCAAPGIVSKHSAKLKRERLALRFANIVEQVARKESLEKPYGPVLTKLGFYSKEALAFRALVYYKMKQDFVDDEWLRGLRWLGGKNDDELARFYNVHS